MKAEEDTVLTKAQVKEALIKASCPPDLIDSIEQDISLWWKTGWLQEILLAQKQAGMREMMAWVEKCSLRNKRIKWWLCILEEDWQDFRKGISK